MEFAAILGLALGLAAPMMQNDVAVPGGMIRVIGRFGHRWFPDRQLLIRGPDSISVVKFSRRKQIFFLGLVGLAVLWLAGASLFTAFSLARSATAALTILRLELADQESQARLMVMSAEETRIAEQRDIAVAEANAARDRAVAQADHARDQTMATAAAAAASDNQRLQALTRQTETTIGQVETVIKSTGLDPDRLAGAPAADGAALAGLTGAGPTAPGVATAAAPGAVPGNIVGSFVQVAPASHPGRAGGLPVVIFPSGPGGAPPFAQIPPAIGPAVNQSSLTPAPGIRADRAALLLNDLTRLQALGGTMAKLPLSTPVALVAISSPYGFRPNPWTGAREFHVGIDLRGAIGTSVFATAPGMVSFAGVSTGYGNLVVIDHGDGLSTRYSHLEKILVSVGAAVALHQQIGLLGNTGWSTGPHLLYETRMDGQPLDPLNFIKVNPYDVQN